MTEVHAGETLGRFCEYHHRTPATATCALCAKATCDVCTRAVNAAALCMGCAVGRATQTSWLAAAFSLLLPGAGQVYNGQFGKAVTVFLLAPLAAPWLWGVYDAAVTADRIAAGDVTAATVPTGGVLLGLKIVWLPVAVFYVVLSSLAVTALMAGVGALLR